jgi:hypothetical protein
MCWTHVAETIKKENKRKQNKQVLKTISLFVLGLFLYIFIESKQLHSTENSSNFGLLPVGNLCVVNVYTGEHFHTCI